MREDGDGGGSSEGRGESERRGRADADEVSDGLDDGDGGEPDEESVSVQVHDHGVEAVEGLWDDDGGGERGEMLGEVTLAMVGGLGLGTLANVIHPYPTQADAVRRVAFQYSMTRVTPFVKRLLRFWLRMTT